MAKYVVKLSEQEELNLRQLTVQPGFDALLKMLQGESLDAQTAAMDCTDLDDRKRSLALLQAQVTRNVVSNLTQKLCAYRELLVTPAPVGESELISNIWDKERTN